MSKDNMQLLTGIFLQITELEEYYPFRTELDMLQQHALDIITHIPVGSVLVELGCGSAQKTAILQRALLARSCALLKVYIHPQHWHCQSLASTISIFDNYFPQAKALTAVSGEKSTTLNQRQLPLV